MVSGYSLEFPEKIKGEKFSCRISPKSLPHVPRIRRRFIKVKCASWNISSVRVLSIFDHIYKSFLEEDCLVA